MKPSEIINSQTNEISQVLIAQSILDQMADDIKQIKMMVEKINATRMTVSPQIPQLFEEREWE